MNFLGLAMVISVNIIANALPLNGQTTGEISARYETLFTPAGFAFSIWSIIYIGLTGFIIYRFGGAPDHKGMPRNDYVFSQLGITFFISCLANVTWIFAWHYEQIALTLLCITALLLSLIDINRRIYAVSQEFVKAKRFRWLVQVPFGIYLGWVSIATIANAAVYLTYENWDALGIAESIWTLAMIIIGGLIGLLLLAWWRLISAAVAIGWGIFGVYVKLWRQDHHYPVQVICIVMIALLLVGIARTLRRRSNTTNSTINISENGTR